MDLSRLKSKLKELEQEESRKSDSTGYKAIWKPTGDHVIRMVPFKHDPQWPFLEVALHYEVTDRPTISPISFNEPDPIVEFCEQLEKKGGDHWKDAQKLKPKTRTYVPIIVRGEEDQGIKFWGFGVTIYRQLMAIMDDADYGSIEDPKNGRDIRIKYTPPTTPGDFRTAKTEIIVKPTVTPMITQDHPHYQTVIESLKNTPRIEDLWEKPTYDDLKQTLTEYLGNREQEEGNNTNSPASNSSNASLKDQLDKGFDALFTPAGGGGDTAQKSDRISFDDLPWND